MADSIILFSGNICAGKTDALHGVFQYQDLFRPYLNGCELKTFAETVVPRHLEAWCAHEKTYGYFFERTNIVNRLMDRMIVRESPGVHTFDRGLIDGFETFTLNACNEGFITKAEYQRLEDLIKSDVEEYLRIDLQDRWCEKYAVYFRVRDENILDARQRRRNVGGESYPLDYYKRINKLHDRYFENINQVYAKYGLRAPHTLEVDASIDKEKDSAYYRRIALALAEKLAVGKLAAGR